LVGERRFGERGHHSKKSKFLGNSIRPPAKIAKRDSLGILKIPSALHFKRERKKENNFASSGSGNQNPHYVEEDAKQQSISLRGRIKTPERRVVHQNKKEGPNSLPSPWRKTGWRNERDMLFPKVVLSGEIGF